MNTLDKINHLLKQQNKKQKDLTDFLSISKNVFTDWKSGKNTSYLKHIRKIAKFLNVSVDYLLGVEKKEANPLLKELTSEQAELIRLFDSAPPELQSAALGFLKAYEAQRQSQDNGK